VWLPHTLARLLVRAHGMRTCARAHTNASLHPALPPPFIVSPSLSITDLSIPPSLLFPPSLPLSLPPSLPLSGYDFYAPCDADLLLHRWTRYIHTYAHAFLFVSCVCVSMCLCPCLFGLCLCPCPFFLCYTHGRWEVSFLTFSLTRQVLC
jgi:hypothetical protein